MHTSHNRRSLSQLLPKMPVVNEADIHLYTAQTPNGIKVSMLLEELGLNYKVSFLRTFLG